MNHTDFVVAPPTLDRFTIQVQLLRTPPSTHATLTVAGYCNRRRDALWSHTEVLPADRGDYTVADAVMHWALISLQESPTTAKAATLALIGQESLF
jgi:hypothetical protein